MGTKRIAARVDQDGDIALCRVTVPKLASRGKLLKLTLTTTSGGKTAKKSDSTRIRAWIPQHAFRASHVKVVCDMRNLA